MPCCASSRDEVRGLGARVAQLEGCLADAGIRAPAAPAAADAAVPEVEAGITEEELLAISAAVAAHRRMAKATVSVCHC